MLIQIIYAAKYPLYIYGFDFDCYVTVNFSIFTKSTHRVDFGHSSL